jgi:hypothetical protein
MRRSSLLAGFVAGLALSLLAAPASAVYHPTLGRWLSRDPAGYQDGMGLYEYAASGPARWADPLGLGLIEPGDPGWERPDTSSYPAPEEGLTAPEPPTPLLPRGPGAAGNTRDESEFYPGDLAQRPAKQCQLDGTPVTMTFNGMAFSGAGHSWSAVSGKPTKTTVRTTTVHGGRWHTTTRTVTSRTFDYSEKRQKENGIGPTKEGKYWIDACCTNSDQNAHRRRWYSLRTGAWGEYSWHLRPYRSNDMSGDKGPRGGFFIHGGNVPGSAGCIDLMGNVGAFKRSIIDEVTEDLGTDECCYINVIVRYRKTRYVHSTWKHRSHPPWTLK